MKTHRPHSWDVTPAQALCIQEAVSASVICHGRIRHPRLVAGADAAFDLVGHRIFAAVVVLAFPELEPIETAVHQARLSFPYIPGSCRSVKPQPCSPPFLKSDTSPISCSSIAMVCPIRDQPALLVILASASTDRSLDVRSLFSSGAFESLDSHVAHIPPCMIRREE